MTTSFFPGQGSQVKGMGAALFDEFSEVTALADEILGYSVKALCLDDPNRLLGQTQYTQPAVFVVNALSYLKWQQANPQPRFVLGHSLGEYNALLAAGVFDFATGLRLVQKRGELMQGITGGGMAAVLGLPAEQAEGILASAFSDLTVANYNTHCQVVITGPKNRIDAATSTFEQAGAMVIPLNVSGAFHSTYLKPLKEPFMQCLQQFHYAAPKIPVIANLTAAPYPADAVVDYLSSQMVSPVLWTKSIQYLLNQGETEFVELGPGKVLTNMTAMIRQGR